MANASSKAQVTQFFGAHASAYAATYAHPSTDLPYLLSLLSPQHHWVVTDIGAGTGRVSAALAPLVQQVIAVDITPAMEQELLNTLQKQNLHNVRFVLGDAEHLPLPAGIADLVTCARAAHHFHAVDVALKEMQRILKDNGRLGIIDMTTPENPAAAALLNDVEKTRDASHTKALSPQEWEATLRQQGFIVDTCTEQTEVMSYSSWWSPVEPSNRQLEQVRHLVDEAPASIRQEVFPTWGAKPLFLKRRIVITAHLQP